MSLGLLTKPVWVIPVIFFEAKLLLASVSSGCTSDASSGRSWWCIWRSFHSVKNTGVGIKYGYPKSALNTEKFRLVRHLSIECGKKVSFIAGIEMLFKENSLKVFILSENELILLICLWKNQMLSLKFCKQAFCAHTQPCICNIQKLPRTI